MSGAPLAGRLCEGPEGPRVRAGRACVGECLAGSQLLAKNCLIVHSEAFLSSLFLSEPLCRGLDVAQAVELKVCLEAVDHFPSERRNLWP